MGIGQISIYIFNTMILNINQHNLMEDKIMRGAHGLYLTNINPLVHIHVYPPALSRVFYRRKTWIW